MPRKPMENITPEQDVMITAYLSGSTKKDAFIKGFPERAKQSKDPDQIALYEFNKKVVIAEIEKRKQARDKALAKSTESEYERIAKLWSREDSVRHLVDIISDCEKSRKSCAIIGKDDAVVTRLERDTLDSLNKMLGYDAPVKMEMDSKISVKFDGGTEDGGEDWTG